MTYAQRPAHPVLPLQTQVVLPPPRRRSAAHVVLAWLGAVLTGFYLLPWAVAATRGRRSALAVAVVNVLLGWTVVGWVVALVMAWGRERSLVLVQHGYGSASWAAPQPWPPPAPAPPARTGPVPARHRPAYEPTVVDPVGYEPTMPLPTGARSRDQH